MKKVKVSHSIASSVPILIFGAGGHAKVVIDCAEKSKKFKVIAVVDEKAKSSAFCGHLVISESEIEKFLKKQKKQVYAVVAIGDNTLRSQVAHKIKENFMKLKFAVIVHPSAQLGKNVEIGEGTVVMAGAVINTDSQIGQHCIINTRAAIDHDCFLANFSSVAPGCTLGGKVKIGKNSAISLGASVIHGISVGDGTVVGAGATVVEDIPANVIAFGTPCKVIRKRPDNEPYL